MAQILTFILQKIYIFALGLCAINYDVADTKYTQLDTKVTAFEIQFGDNTPAFSASFDNESGKTNWENLNFNSETHFRKLSFSFSE